MIFGIQHQIQNIGDIDIIASGVKLEKVSKFKYLGIVLDPTLTFSEHVKNMKGKCHSKIKLLGRIRNIIDQQTALTIYETLILPVFDYCDYLLLNISNHDSEQLQKLQNCAFRTILRVERLTPTQWTHSTLQMDTLHARRSMHTAVQVFKSLNNQTPIGCQRMFEYTF